MIWASSHPDCWVPRLGNLGSQAEVCGYCDLGQGSGKGPPRSRGGSQSSPLSRRRVKALWERNLRLGLVFGCLYTSSQSCDQFYLHMLVLKLRFQA